MTASWPQKLHQEKLTTYFQEIAKFTANSRLYHLQKTCFVAIIVEPRISTYPAQQILSSFPRSPVKDFDKFQEIFMPIYSTLNSLRQVNICGVDRKLKLRSTNF